MIRVGDQITCDDGRRLRVEAFHSAGGQGAVYRVREQRKGTAGALKIYTRQDSDTLPRLRYLLDQDLQAACPVLWSPRSIVSTPVPGHYTPWADGRQMEDCLGAPPFDFQQALQIGVALSHAVGVLHDRGIAHGDLHSGNVLLDPAGRVLQTLVIDFDNFTAPGVAPAPCVGHELYMAPELREAAQQGRRALPSPEADRFALGVMLHELLLLRHPVHGREGEPEVFHRAMCSGQWLQDPMCTGATCDQGYPAGVLHTDLQRLFRVALSLDPERRPTARAWCEALLAAHALVHACPRCSQPVLAEPARIECASCRRPFPHLLLKLAPSGQVIPLVEGQRVLGRNDLGGSRFLSARHVIIQRVGPETWADSVGTNGCYRMGPSGWVGLPKGPQRIDPGDRLRLADVEAEVLESA